jgi:hypothetical protein
MKEMRHAEAPRRTGTWVLLLAGALATAVLVAGFTVQGIQFLVSVQAFLEYYSGVFALVGLSVTVMWGLAATDRLVMSIRFRILFQVAHRVITFMALGFLGIHVVLKILTGQAAVIDAFVPFVASRVAVGLGTVAAIMWILIAVTGIFRARYATRGQPWMWRMLHSTAYLCWPIALVHGLTAGREARMWVIVSYAVCLGAVGLGLVVRIVSTIRLKEGGENRRVVPLGRRIGSQTGPIKTTDGALDAEFWASLRKEVRR